MSTAASIARREWGLLYAPVRTALATQGWRAIPLTLTAACLVVLFQSVQDQGWGHGFVRDIGFVRAADPLWLALLRTPASLFVPALSLPVWGAVAQVLLMFGIAEITLGRWRTLVVAYVCTLAGTLYARFGVAVGPDGPLGLPASDARIVDTGPSAAVAGLAVCVCVSLRAWFTGALVIVAMAVEVIVKPNLAGREHLVAVGAALLLCAVAALRRCRSTGGGDDSGKGGGDGGAGRSGTPSAGI
ncbi:hypothetical protein [Streptomyces yaizuensis]|uniref:Integral membrane protein n=1 Tax=Streptomyces yaizuensis TaxID=2989713 RepID=A0ABQ5NRA5_9ACTN|nr:hypothetical protein [Streptomyces sp. YSPA8]GLF92865.1 hypothetical protein SYYSPA8_01230 [Streptomyces sp. YSPA8]